MSRTYEAVQVTKPGAEDRNKIGIIGAGAVGSAFARALARVGIGADISTSRGPASREPSSQQRPHGRTLFSSP